jgi:hypothetical protein
MKFARFVFIGAGVWGVVVLTPLLFLVDISGRHYASPTSYPQFFYGFMGVALAWQLVFLVIGSDPMRFRPLMIPAIVEKAGFIIPASVLYAHGRITAQDASAAIPDAILAVLFIVALVRSSAARPATPSRPW